jgi:hypothetical protein
MNILITGRPSSSAVAMMDAVSRGWPPMPGSSDAFVSSVSHDDAATAVVASRRRANASLGCHAPSRDGNPGVSSCPPEPSASRISRLSRPGSSAAAA